MKIFLFDLDNTIANMDHRLPLLDKEEVDWDAFEAECVKDEPIVATIEVMRSMDDLGHGVWIWTGRSDGVLKQTKNWLWQQQVPYDHLLMRPHGMEIGTRELKKRWLNDDPVPRSKVIAAFDDDPKIVDMLLKEGVLTYQVKRPDDAHRY